ncbi:MAG: hypothetical protein HY060_11970, partial [Proteobacteria bacterium]|nr:hypothetical protein [Pseudomonadota bacterium]
APPPVFVAPDVAAVRAAAAAREIKLPEKIAFVSPGPEASREAVVLLGAWGGDDRWGGGGRQALLVIEEIKPSGIVRGIFAEGPPGQTSYDQAAGAYFGRIEATLRDGGVEWTTRAGFFYRFALAPGGDRLAGMHRTPPTHKVPNNVGRIELIRLGAPRRG